MCVLTADLRADAERMPLIVHRASVSCPCCTCMCFGLCLSMIGSQDSCSSPALASTVQGMIGGGLVQTGNSHNDIHVMTAKSLLRLVKLVILCAYCMMLICSKQQSGSLTFLSVQVTSLQVQ